MHPTGKIVVAGSTNSRSAWAVTRLLPDGSLDTSFSGDGRDVKTFVGFTDEARTVAVQSDGRIVLGGGAIVTQFDGSRMVLVRYNVDGTPDTTFDGDGTLVLAQRPSNFEETRALVLQADGNIEELVATTRTLSRSELTSLIRHFSRAQPRSR